MKPTVTRRRPRAASACTIASPSAAVAAMGFSHSTGLPAAKQASAEPAGGGAGGGQGDAPRLHLIRVDQRMGICEHCRPLRSKGGATGIWITNSGQMRAVGDTAQQAGVFRPHHARTDHANRKAHFTSIQICAVDEAWMVSTSV